MSQRYEIDSICRPGSHLFPLRFQGICLKQFFEKSSVYFEHQPSNSTKAQHTAIIANAITACASALYTILPHISFHYYQRVYFTACEKSISFLQKNYRAVC